MKKSRVLAVGLAAAAPVLAGAGTAEAAVFDNQCGDDSTLSQLFVGPDDHPHGGSWHDTTRDLKGQQDVFIDGGDELGRGGAELLSSAVIGVPQEVLDGPAHLLGLPKRLEYSSVGPLEGEAPGPLPLAHPIF